MNSDLLHVDTLSVFYPDGTMPVREVSFSLASGTIMALLGPSGSGKSSLLRGIAGLESTRGRLVLDGVDISSMPAYRRGIGMMFQDGQLFPHRTVAGNIAYGLEAPAAYGGMSSAERPARIKAMLELVDLAGFGPRDVATLSGGQAQRVALARALAPRPSLLLLDEPLSALDAELRVSLGSELREILTQTGTGGIYVTHDREEAARIADVVMVMDRGILIPAS